MYIITIWQKMYIVTLTRTSLTFSIYLWAMYIVYNRWLYVWLFKFNHFKDITTVHHHNLARSLHCYITSRTSSTFFNLFGIHMYIVYNRWLYVWLFEFTHWKDIFLVLIDHHNLAKNIHCYVTTRTSSTFSIYLRSIVYSL